MLGAPASEHGRERGTATVTHLHFKFFSDAELLVGLDDEMVLVEVLNDEVLLVIHGEQDLLHGRVADERPAFGARRVARSI